MEFTRPEPQDRGSFNAVLTLIADRLSIWQRRHLDRRRVVLLIVVAVGMLVTTRVVSNAEATIDRLGPTRSVVVARQDLAAGATIGRNDIETTTWPVGQVPAGATERPDDVVGKTLRSTVGVGEPIAWHRLGPGRFGLTEGERSVTLPLPLAPPPVEVGDQVELIGLGAIGTSGMIATTNLGSARILVVTEDGITVAVDRAQVEAILMQAAAGVVEIIGSPLG